MISALAGAVLLVTLLSPPADATETVRAAHYTMGTLLEVTVEAPDRETGLGWIDRAVGEVRRLEARLSNWQTTSNVSALNERAGQDADVIDRDLFAVLGQARSLSIMTGRAFDVTAGTWFAPPGGLPDPRGDLDQAGRPADEKTLAAAVGPHNLILRSGRRAALGSEWTRVDLGGIVKGYALRAAIDALREAGATRAFLDFGRSSMIALGGGHAAVAIEPGGSPAGSLVLTDLALSSSESLAPAEADEPAHPHIVDPATGRWIRAERHATVVGSDPAEVEAWSTALIVDPDAVLPRAEHAKGIEAVVFEGGRVRMTSGFATAVDWKEELR